MLRLRTPSENDGRKKYACTYRQIVFALLYGFCLYVILCSIQMCLSQHHCVNNPWDDLISLISLTNDRGCPMCQHQSPPVSPVSSGPLSLSPMSNYEHDINVIKKPSSDLTSTLGSIYFLYLSLGSYPASQI